MVSLKKHMHSELNSGVSFGNLVLVEAFKLWANTAFYTDASKDFATIFVA